MARILLATTDTAHGSFTTTKAALELGGHTVTGSLDTTAALDAAWAGGTFDLIATTRFTAGTTAATASMTWLKDKWVAGTPLLIGGTEGGAASGATAHFAKFLGIIKDARTRSSTTAPSPAGTNLRIGAAHAITTGFTPGTEYPVLDAANWTVVDFFLGAQSGVELGDIYSTADDGLYMAAVETGDALVPPGATNTLGLTTAPARAVFCGWLYAGQSDYHANGKTILDQTADWLATVAAPEPEPEPTPEPAPETRTRSEKTVGQLFPQPGPLGVASGFAPDPTPVPNRIGIASVKAYTAATIPLPAGSAAGDLFLLGQSSGGTVDCTDPRIVGTINTAYAGRRFYWGYLDASTDGFAVTQTGAFNNWGAAVLAVFRGVGVEAVTWTTGAVTPATRYPNAEYVVVMASWNTGTVAGTRAYETADPDREYTFITDVDDPKQGVSLYDWAGTGGNPASTFYTDGTQRNVELATFHMRSSPNGGPPPPPAVGVVTGVQWTGQLWPRPDDLAQQGHYESLSTFVGTPYASPDWRYLLTTEADAVDRSAPAFDDTTWSTGLAPFGKPITTAHSDLGWPEVGTVTNVNTGLWLRRTVTAVPGQTARVSIRVDGAVRVYWNGVSVANPGEAWSLSNTGNVVIPAEDVLTENILAVRYVDDTSDPAGDWFYADAEVSGVGAAAPVWAVETTAPVARYDHTSGTSDAVVYVAGGRVSVDGAAWAPSTRVDRYTIATGIWDTRAALDIPLCGTLASGWWSGKFFIAGGNNGNGGASDKIRVYNPTTDDWAIRSAAIPGPTPDGAGGNRHTMIDGVLYLVGGAVNGAPTDTVLAYDVGEDAWGFAVGTQPYPIPIAGHGADRINDRLYVCGGWTTDGEATSRMYRFNPGTGRWKRMANMPGARTGHAVRVLNDRLYVMGGALDNAGGAPKANTWRYSPKTDSWEVLSPLPRAAYGLTPHAVGGTLGIIGGTNGVLPGRYEMDRLDNVQETWVLDDWSGLMWPRQ